MEKIKFLESVKVPEKCTTRDSVREFMDVMMILQDEGVNVGKIKQTIGGRNNSHFIVLEEIEQDGINIGEISGRTGIPLDYKIGRKINEMKNAIKGNAKGINLNEQEKQDLEMVLTNKKTAMEELIEVLQILKANGIEVDDIQLRVNNIPTTIKDLKENPSVNIYGILEQMKEKGYNSEFPLGSRLIGAKRFLKEQSEGYVKQHYYVTPKENILLKKLVGLPRLYNREK